MTTARGIFKILRAVCIKIEPITAIHCLRVTGSASGSDIFGVSIK